MLRAICGVARPYRGKITVFGRRLKDWKRAELFRGGVAMLPQDPLNLMVKKTVRGDLEEMLDGRGLTAEQRTAAVREVAALTDIVPLLDAHLRPVRWRGAAGGVGQGAAERAAAAAAR